MSEKRPRFDFKAFLILALLVCLAVTVLRAWRGASALYEAELRADSLAAAVDTTRIVMGGAITAYQRRAIQAEVRADELDRQLGMETRARARAEVRVDELEAHAEAEVEVREDIRTAEFEVEDEAWSLLADVSLPPPPAMGRGTFHVTLAPIPMTFRVGCLEENGRHVRPATVTVEAPEWARVQLEDVIQAPAVCSPPPRPWFQLHLPATIATAAAGAVVGVVVGDGAEDIAIGAGTGFLVGWVLRRF